jgi:hypothetical protein
MFAQGVISPKDRHRSRSRLPRLDLVGDSPKGAGGEPLQLIIVGEQLGGILDIGAPDNVFTVVSFGLDISLLSCAVYTAHQGGPSLHLMQPRLPTLAFFSGFE